MSDGRQIAVLHRYAMPLSERATDFRSLFEAIGVASYVLIGETSHGTHEFYQVRAEITKQLMWRNQVVEQFADWLRCYNDSRPNGVPQAGFYGLDLYSMNTSRAEVVRYLDRVDAQAARRAHERYACFDHFGEDEQAYGMAAGFGVSESCENEVVQQLTDLRLRAYEYIHRDGHVAEDDFFSAEQNARLVRNAEEYYRSMFPGRVSSWNLRDRHMSETLHALAAWLERRFGSSKIVVWEHNSHLGDARATEMGRRGEFNVGQLARQRYPGEVFNVGFTTYTGTVTAASDWGGEAERKNVRPGLPDSWEELFHRARLSDFLLVFNRDPGVSAELAGERLERAIGVVYRPDTERLSHYFLANMTKQFDAVIHIETTRAVEPLDRWLGVSEEVIPETFPFGV